MPQIDSGGLHEATQVELLQKSPLHDRPHAPQLAPSARVSTHWPLQLESGGPQLQAPATQSSREPQAVPHAPQLRRAAVTSMHRPLQNDWPAGQVCEHAPAWHTAPAAQARPHAPQFASSVWSSAQRPEHVVWFAAHPTTPG